MTDYRFADLGPPGATVSAIAVDETGTVLAKRNPDTVVAPASNTKLVTAAVALDSLSPDFRVATTVQTSGRIVDDQLYGDVRFIGRAAPDFDRADVRSLARAVGDRVDTVTGDVVLDTTFFEGAEYGPGRAWEDARFAYGAPTTALSVGKNVVSLRVSVDAAGGVSTVTEPATPVVEVDIGEFTVRERPSSGAADTDARSGAPADSLSTRAEPCTGDVHVSGTLPKGGDFETRVPVRRAIEQVKHVVSEALADAGVAVHGDPVTGAKPHSSGTDATPTQLGSVTSAPLADLLRTMNVESNNVVADTLARGVAAHATGTGSWSAWAEVVRDELDALGVESGRIADGSGLSRYNRLSARTMVTVLRHAADSPWCETFFESLPVPGEGTLSDRLHGVSVRAKTGTLIDTRALSGRLRRNGESVYFSLLVDDITRDRSAVRENQDAVVRALAGHDGCGAHTP
jgi:D-alanyl-D-alanine carboxypeptidase/D-alanyl-D-alanine-endopeptidase (penicillin-binding protein 4)